MGKRICISKGDKFGELTIIKELNPNITPCGTRQRRFLCKCVCGNEVIRHLSSLLHSNGISCGCLDFNIGEINRKYTKEQKNSFLYSTWVGMRQRCYYKKSTHYRLYGARGITVCDEWRNDYLAFYNWSIEHGASEELTLDRIDNDKGYSPNNCRWATLEQQANNKSTSRFISYNGVSKTVMEWSKYRNINEGTIRSRIDRYGYSIGQALEYEPAPIRIRKRESTRKPVLQFDLNGNLIREWNSLQEINERLGYKIGVIRHTIYGTQKSSYGYKWKYRDGIKKQNKL